MDFADLKSDIQQAYRDFLARKQINPRYGQRLMIAELVRNLIAIEQDAEGQRVGESHVTVIEAGTGTGKTLAYLLAVLPTAKLLDKKVVLATATVALQDQVVNKDIPDLLANTALSFQYSLAKGRGRYLCPSKLHNLLHPEQDAGTTLALWEEYQAVALNQDELTLYRQLEKDFNNQSWNGDRDSWGDRIEDRYWYRVTNDHRGCTGRNCTYYDSCPFFLARADIYRSDLIVANHDLVLADLAMGGGVVLPAPEDTIYLFDEGHHLPDKALGHFACSAHLNATQQWLKELPKLTESLVQQSGNGSLVEFQRPRIESLCQSIGDKLFGLIQSVNPLQEQLETSERVGANLSQTHRFSQGKIPAQLREQAASLRGPTVELVAALQLVAEWLQEGMEDKRPDITKAESESWLPVVSSQVARAESMASVWSAYEREDAPGKVPIARWVSFTQSLQGGDVELAASPVLACDVLVNFLWRRAFAVVVTSATLTVSNRFDRFQFRAGTPENSHFCIVPSPFNYEVVGSIHIPALACDPVDEWRHTEQVTQFLEGLERNAVGTLVLFNSRRQMEDVFDSLSTELKSLVLTQGQLGKAEIVRRHKNAVDQGLASMIFGLASFAEGVDLPGSYCSRVVIARLPFSVPEDPVDATLAEWVKEKKGNPFLQLTVPDAAIRLKQAVGRLIRTEQDIGEVYILDRRIIEKRYGKLLLSSLPPFPVIVGS